ncbi:ATP-binding cassette sub-family C member 4 [Halotydeus destructor]|nr:ATP-binding cassette sub-family C member 4 [Halotydeus destructor]
MKVGRVTNANVYDLASWPSRVTFAWTVPLFIKGYLTQLQFEDVFKFHKDDDPVKATDELEQLWEKREPKSTFKRMVLTKYLPYYFLLGLPLFLVENSFRIVQSFAIGYLTKYFSGDKSITIAQVYMWSCVYLSGTLIFAICRSNFYYHGVRYGMRIRVAMEGLVYRKILRLSSSSFQDTSPGQVLNMMANDFLTFEYAAYDVVYFLIAPVQSAICIIVMWNYIGISTLTGMTLLLLLVPFQAVMMRLFGKFRRQTTLRTDARGKLMKEIIAAMRLIKLYCWEQPFAEEVDSARRKEVAKLRNKAYLLGINMAFNFCGTKVILFATLVTHVLLGGRLDAETVFVVMSLFDTLSYSVTGCLPYSVSSTAECVVACNRIEKLLALKDREGRKPDSDSPKGQLVMKDYSAKWSPPGDSLCLSGIDLRISPNELIMVVGSVGSGKSSLFHAILNELYDVSGSCLLDGKISYSPQESWCFSGSIKDNILFTCEYDEERYLEVLEVCGLKRDLEMFPDKDQTIVGEKGYTLSGGQKARVTLARCVYRQADIYLLDDPLSAVDPAVSKHIFKQCVEKFLGKKTVVLTTHQLQFLDRADQVVVLEGGKMVATGKYEELMREKVDFLAFLETKKDESRKYSVDEEINIDDQLELSRKNYVEVDEKTQSGTVVGKVYWEYFRSGSSAAIVILVFVSIIVAQWLYNYCDLWLTAWTEKYNDPTELTENAVLNEATNIAIYSSLTLVLFVSAFVRTIGLYLLCLQSSISLHNSIFSKLLLAPMSFFEATPMGRILNRFTRDIGYVDQHLPDTIGSITDFKGLVSCLGVVYVSAVVSPWLLIPAVVLVCVAIPCRSVYMKTAMDLTRLSAISNSPLYNHVTSTFDGLTSIRAFGLERHYEGQYFHYINDAFSCNYLTNAASRTLAMCLDMVTLIFCASINVFLLLFPDQIPGAQAGLLLSTVLTLTGLFSTRCAKRPNWKST